MKTRDAMRGNIACHPRSHDISHHNTTQHWW